MNLQELLREGIFDIVKNKYGVELNSIEFQATRKEFDGDVTLVIFSMLRKIKGNPVEIGEIIGKTSRTTLTKYMNELVTYKILRPRKDGVEVFYINDDLIRILEG